MKVNIPKLKGKIIENNTTQEGLALGIGMHRATFHRKMKSDGGGFTLQEMWDIVECLKLDQPETQEIFFCIM